MNQTPSNSQTSELDANKSQPTECALNIPSTGILYQHPPSSQQIAKANKQAKVKAWSQDAFLVVVLLGTIGSVPFTVRSCSNDVDRQHAAALKYQLQFSASSSEGAR